MNTISIQYQFDKETKSTHRFVPATDAEAGKIGAGAYLYLQKDICERLGIQKELGFVIEIKPAKQETTVNPLN